MFRLCFASVVLAAGVAMTLPAVAQDKKPEQKRPSPTETITAMVGGKGGAEIKITYSRPYSKDPKSEKEVIRKIWGELVPYGKPWRTGANEATTFETTGDLMVGGAKVPAGKYTLYTIPEEKGTSKLAISKTTGQPGEPVDDKNDLVRVDLKKEKLDKRVDQFTIAIVAEKDQPNGMLKLMWENLQFSVPVAAAKK